MHDCGVVGRNTFAFGALCVVCARNIDDQTTTYIYIQGLRLLNSIAANKDSYGETVFFLRIYTFARLARGIVGGVFGAI